MLLTILVSLSQEESRSISENVNWGIRKKMTDGKFSLGYSHFLGYDKGEDGTLVINEEEAKVIRRITRFTLRGCPLRHRESSDRGRNKKRLVGKHDGATAPSKASFAMRNTVGGHCFKRHSPRIF